MEKLQPSELIVDTDLECELRSDGEKRVISVHEQVLRKLVVSDKPADLMFCLIRSLE
jgi:hypothetical protein